MGYNTDFYGRVTIRPPLSQDEVSRIEALGEGRLDEELSGAPDSCCQWVPAPDGSALEWDRGEKFYYAAEWMKYLIDRFLRASHSCNGTIEARGEESGDEWQIVVEDNMVSTVLLALAPVPGSRRGV